jgi:hypothetical protein
MGARTGAYRVLVGKPEGNRPLGKPMRRWEDNIEMDLQKVGPMGVKERIRVTRVMGTMEHIPVTGVIGTMEGIRVTREMGTMEHTRVTRVIGTMQAFE